MSGNVVFIGFHGAADRSTPESQNELVAALLEDAGFSVRSASAKKRQLARLTDQIILVARSLRWADVVVTCHFSGRRAWTNVVIARLTRRAAVPTIMVLRGGALPEHARSHPRQVDSTLDLVTRVLAPSTYLQREFEERGHRVGIVPNFVRMPVVAERADIDPSAPAILWMRAFHPTYQPELAIRAFAELVEQLPCARLTMAGPDRGLLASTEALVRELGLGDRVTFPGYLEGDDKVGAFASHDIFLNTTQIDNTPVSVIEAMGAGMPVVATDVGGLRDLARADEDALLVADGDARGLAEAMARIATDAELADRLRTGGRAIAAHHDAEHVRESWKVELAELGARIDPPPRDGCASLSGGDLADVVSIHMRAFPDSALTRLGPRAVHRYYSWQFSGPHPEPVALGSWRDGTLVGFLVGGARHGAVAGFTRSSPGVLAAGIVTHPLVLRRVATSKVHAVVRAMRHGPQATTRGPQTTAAPDPTSTPDADPVRSFGVLSVAVERGWQGNGVGDELLAAAESEARRRGFTRMNLSVNVDNDRAVRFYEKHGWHRSGAPWDGKMVKDLTEESVAGPIAETAG